MRWWGWLLLALGLVASAIIAWVAISARSVVSGATSWTEGLSKLGAAIDNATGFWSWFLSLWGSKGKESNK